MSYTPGPWEVYTPFSKGTYGIDGATGAAVVFFGTDDENGIRKLEDARLIAAAPDLLEALQDCTEALTHFQDALHVRVNPPTLEKARAAILKATGEQK